MVPTTRARSTGSTRPDDDERFSPMAYPLVGIPGAVLLYLAMVNSPVPVWAPWPLTLAGAAITYLFGRRRVPRPVVVFRTVCWLAPATWATVTYVLVKVLHNTSQVLLTSAVVLVTAGVIAALMARALRPDPADDTIVPPVAASLGPRSSEHPKAMQIRHLLNTLLKLPPDRGLTLANWKVWDRDAGYTAVLEFPPRSGVTIKRVQQLVDDVMAELRLPMGCRVRITSGPHNASVRVEVTLVNQLLTVREYPTDLSPRSIRDPLAIGFKADGSDALINVHQDSALIVGQPGSGKTVMLHDLIASLLRCRDTLLFVVDVNGGGVALPWLRPYAADHTTKPAIDWIAPNLDEALKMADFLYAVAQTRKAQYAALAAAQNVDILPVSPKIPAIIVLVDEGGEIFGDSAGPEAAHVARRLLAVQRISRAMCIRFVLTSLRGTGTYLPSDMKKACPIRAVGKVDGDDEIANVLDWHSGCSVDQLVAKGQFFLREMGGGGSPELIRSFDLKPNRIATIVEQTSDHRPDGLDDVSRAVDPALYDQRWQRIRPWLRGIAGLPPEEDDDAPATPVKVDRYKSTAEILEEVQRLANKPVDFDQPIQPPRNPAPAQRQDEPPVSDEQLAAVEPAADDPPQWAVEHLALLAEASNPHELLDEDDPLQGLPPVALRLYALLDEAGPDGLKTEVVTHTLIEEGLTQRRQTVAEWTAELRRRGLVSSHPKGWAQWVAARHLPPSQAA